MATFGQKHLISCRCILPQFKNNPNSKQHRFVVFSEVVEDITKQKYAQCNNCGLIHKVIDICTSEIVQGKEAMSSIISIEDIKTGMNQSLIGILERHLCDLSTWEHARYVIDNKRWGDIIVLTNDNEDNNIIIKYVRILGEGIFKVDSYTRKDAIGN